MPETCLLSVSWQWALPPGPPQQQAHTSALTNGPEGTDGHWEPRDGVPVELTGDNAGETTQDPRVDPAHAQFPLDSGSGATLLSSEPH